MKNYISFIITVVIGFTLFACQEEPFGQQPIDNVPPGPISDVKVKSIPGGCILTYSLPQDKDLLYVKAVYSLTGGIISDVRTSLYLDTLTINGFGDIAEKEIKLIAVDRSRNESPVVIVKVAPLEPIIYSVGKSLDLIASFGGLNAYWSNPSKEQIAVYITRVKDSSSSDEVPVASFYNSLAIGNMAIHGLDTVSVKFGMYAKDRWGNRSEVKYFMLKPLFEAYFDKAKFREVNLPGDGPIRNPMTKLWNEIRSIEGEYFDTSWGTGIMPQSFTFDLGVTGRVSRIVNWPRQYTLFWNENFRYFEVWGCKTLDVSGSWDSWTKLADCESIKPSGLPSQQNTAEDIESVKNGENFPISPKMPSVRYLRFKVLESWDKVDAIESTEIDVYGDYR